MYRNPSPENNSENKVDEFVNELNNTLDNIKGIKSRHQLCTVWWDDTTDYPGESISDITGLHGLHEIINQ